MSPNWVPYEWSTVPNSKYVESATHAVLFLYQSLWSTANDLLCLINGSSWTVQIAVSVHLGFICPHYYELIHNFLLLIASERGAEGKAGAGSMNWLIFRLRCRIQQSMPMSFWRSCQNNDQGFIKLKANSHDDSYLNGWNKTWKNNRYLKRSEYIFYQTHPD